MSSKSKQNFELFKTGMKSDSFSAAVNEHEQTQAEFVATLERNQFTYAQILELTNTTQDPQVKSLLIIYLLSQKNYINNLNGECYLTKISTNAGYSPSRLNALVHELDIRTLTLPMLEKLHPEAAVTLLCSVPHFHQFKEMQVEAMLRKNPLTKVINYWLHHFTTFPNAHFTLAHLINLADAEVSISLSKMDAFKKSFIINKIIMHLELFDPQNILLRQEPDEDHLILAIRLYLNGHTHSAYVTYISELTEILINQNHQFSVQAIQLLISLKRSPEFDSLSTKTAYITNHYLRTCAQSGDVSLFYDEGRLNLISMTQLVQLKHTVVNTSTISNLFAMIGGSKPETKEELTTELDTENALLKELIRLNKPIKTFDYYLMHYKGRGAKIGKVISDYLNSFAHDNQESPSKNIYHTCILMNKKELNPLVREAIFNSFLHYPDLFDAQISAYMLLYNAKTAIQHFGLKGGADNYKRVIHLCTGALAKLNPEHHRDIIHIAKKALFEAKTELQFSQETGFFAQLFRRFIRCWRSGWTGLFLPNLPTYVIAAEAELQVDIQDQQPTVDNLSYKQKKSLPVLLATIKKKISQPTLDAIIDALKNYSLEVSPLNEIETRKAVHELFHLLLNESKHNKGLDNWLMRQQEQLIENRFRLLELLLENGNQAEIRILINEINGDSQHFNKLTNELYSELTEHRVEEPTEEEASSISQPTISESTTELVDAAKGLADAAKGYLGAASGYASNWASALGGFFAPMPTAKETDASPPAMETTLI